MMVSTHSLAQTTSALQNSTVNKITVKIAHSETENSAKHKTLLKLKDEIERKFPNRIVFDIQENNKLYNNKQVLEALELGAINIAVPTLTNLSEQFKIQELQLFDLPYLFNNKNEVLTFLQSPLNAKLLHFINNKNSKVQAVSIWVADPKVYSSSIPMRTANDFRSQTFRTDSTGISKKNLEALGAKNIKIASVEELNESLKQQNNLRLTASELSISEYMLKEVFKNNKQKTITLSKHGYEAFAVLINARWMNSLPEDIRNELIFLSNRLSVSHFDLANNIADGLLDVAKDNGVNIYELTPKEQEGFRRAVAVSHQFYLENINREFLLEVYQLKRQKNN